MYIFRTAIGQRDNTAYVVYLALPTLRSRGKIGKPRRHASQKRCSSFFHPAVPGTVHMIIQYELGERCISIHWASWEGNFGPSTHWGNEEAPAQVVRRGKSHVQSATTKRLLLTAAAASGIGRGEGFSNASR